MTTKDLSTASPQAVFDFIVAHLRKQKCRSIKNGRWLYRHPSGLRCAAGSLIADEDYKPEMEGHPWHYLVFKQMVPGFHLSLIEVLQDIHDRFPVENWETEFKKLSLEHNLKYELVS